MSTVVGSAAAPSSMTDRNLKRREIPACWPVLLTSMLVQTGIFCYYCTINYQVMWATQGAAIALNILLLALRYPVVSLVSGAVELGALCVAVAMLTTPNVFSTALLRSILVIVSCVASFSLSATEFYMAFVNPKSVLLKEDFLSRALYMSTEMEKNNVVSLEQVQQKSNTDTAFPLGRLVALEAGIMANSSESDSNAKEVHSAQPVTMPCSPMIEREPELEQNLSTEGSAEQPVTVTTLKRPMIETEKPAFVMTPEEADVCRKNCEDRMKQDEMYKIEQQKEDYYFTKLRSAQKSAIHGLTTTNVLNQAAIFSTGPAENVSVVPHMCDEIDIPVGQVMKQQERAEHDSEVESDAASEYADDPLPLSMAVDSNLNNHFIDTDAMSQSAISRICFRDGDVQMSNFVKSNNSIPQASSNSSSANNNDNLSEMVRLQFPAPSEYVRPLAELDFDLVSMRSSTSTFRPMQMQNVPIISTAPVTSSNVTVSAVNAVAPATLSRDITLSVSPRRGVRGTAQNSNLPLSAQLRASPNRRRATRLVPIPEDAHLRDGLVIGGLFAANPASSVNASQVHTNSTISLNSNGVNSASLSRNNGKIFGKSLLMGDSQGQMKAVRKSTPPRCASPVNPLGLSMSTSSLDIPRFEATVVNTKVKQTTLVPK